jgi:hypothetical protein
MTYPDDIAERAESLRVLLTMAGEEPAMTAKDRERLGIIDSLDPHDQYLIDHHHFSADDFGLALDLLDTAHLVRDFQWRMLEELLALLPGGAAPLPKQLLALREDEPRFYHACWRVAQLDWIHPPNQGDS